MASKTVPVFKFTDGTKPNVTWYTTEEYKALNQNKEEVEMVENKYPSQEVQEQKYRELVKLLHKEVTTKTNDYMGVEDGNIYFNDNFDGHDYHTMCNRLLFNALTELESMTYGGHEYVCDEYDDEQPFKTGRAVKQYIVRLAKFVVKYAPVYLDTEEEIEYFIKEAKGYI